MRDRVEMFCAWAGIAGITAMAIGFLPAAHFIPPLSPSMSASEVATVFQHRSAGIKTASGLILITIAAFQALYVGISHQIHRMSGETARKWSSVQLALGILSLAPLYATAISWALAAYRPDRSPELVQLLNDIGWFNFVMPAPCITLQLLSIGFATLSDQGPDHVYPRWYGFISLWVAILILTGLAIPFFMTGVFAWDGLLAFWMPVGIFGNYVVLTIAMVMRAAKR